MLVAPVHNRNNLDPSRMKVRVKQLLPPEAVVAGQKLEPKPPEKAQALTLADKPIPK